MTLTPMPFLRAGLLILALGFAIAFGSAAASTAGAWTIGLAAFAVLSGLSEVLVRRVAANAAAPVKAGRRPGTPGRLED